MKATILSSDFQQLISGTRHISSAYSNFSYLFNQIPSLRFHNNSGFCWNFSKHKPKPIMKNFGFGLVVRAASSSSPSLDASDYSEQLIGEQMKKKQRSVAGIDQDELLEPRNLADKDSCFCEFEGVHIHYKLCEPELDAPTGMQEKNSSQSANANKNVSGFPIVLLHGFGASTFSWHRVMKPFAQSSGSKVLAYDRPAFGLTSRVSHSVQPKGTNDTTPLNPYSMAFSVLATLYFVDFLSSKKAVLVGHSAGCLTAVEAYFEAPDRVAALILVAPAIFAPRSTEKAAKDQVQENDSGPQQSQNPFLRLGQSLSKLFGYVLATIMQVLKGVIDMVNSLYQKALSAILRSALAVTLVRLVIDKFGIAGIKNAWYDATQVTDHILHGYTKPLRTKNWDKALVEFTVAMLTDPQNKLKLPLQKRLPQIKCPVLIVTGDTDRLVPAWNAARLSQAIPGSQLEIISKCGHLPQEEKPDELISIVTKFLQNVFADKELCFQT